MGQQAEGRAGSRHMQKHHRGMSSLFMVWRNAGSKGFESSAKMAVVRRAQGRGIELLQWLEKPLWGATPCWGERVTEVLGD